MDTILVITEKPLVAQAIAKVLGAYDRQEGYIQGSGYIISWCYGHLAEYAQPDAYDERYAKWRFDDLPIVPAHWRLSLSKGKENQFDLLKGLLLKKEVEYVVNACDAGR